MIRQATVYTYSSFDEIKNLVNVSQYIQAQHSFSQAICIWKYFRHDTHKLRSSPFNVSNTPGGGPCKWKEFEILFADKVRDSPCVPNARLYYNILLTIFTQHIMLSNFQTIMKQPKCVFQGYRNLE